MTPEQQHLQLLMQAFDFDWEDWQINQIGKLSTRQKRLRKTLPKLRLSLVIIQSLLVGALVGLFILSIISSRVHSISPFGIFCLLISQVISILVNSVVIWLRIKKNTLVKTLNEIAVLDKALVVYRWVWFGKTMFYLKPKQFYALRHGERYQVYYAGKRIVGLCPANYAEQLPYWGNQEESK